VGLNCRSDVIWFDSSCRRLYLLVASGGLSRFYFELRYASLFLVLSILLLDDSRSALIGFVELALSRSLLWQAVWAGQGHWVCLVSGYFIEQFCQFFLYLSRNFFELGGFGLVSGWLNRRIGLVIVRSWWSIVRLSAHDWLDSRLVPLCFLSWNGIDFYSLQYEYVGAVCVDLNLRSADLRGVPNSWRSPSAWSIFVCAFVYESRDQQD